MPFHTDLTIGLYNSLYYPTNRDKLSCRTKTAKRIWNLVVSGRTLYKIPFEKAWNRSMTVKEVIQGHWNCSYSLFDRPHRRSYRRVLAAHAPPVSGLDFLKRSSQREIYKLNSTDHLFVRHLVSWFRLWYSQPYLCWKGTLTPTNQPTW